MKNSSYLPHNERKIATLDVGQEKFATKNVPYVHLDVSVMDISRQRTAHALFWAIPKLKLNVLCGNGRCSDIETEL